MNTRKILVDTLHLSGLRVWTILIAIVTTYATAGLLGRHGFGVLAVFLIIPQLAAYASLGWDQAAMRDLPHLLGAGEDAKAEHTRAIAYTAELLMTFGWMVVAAIAALAIHSPAVRLGILLGAASLFVARLTRLFVIDAFVAKDFKLQARVGMAVALANAVFQILAAWKFGAVAAFGGTVLANLVGLILYWSARGLHLRLRFDRTELRRLTRVGYPMAFLGLVSGTTGATTYISRGLIGAIAGLSVLGLFTFGMSLNNYLIAFVGDFGRTYQPHLLEALARPAGRDQIRKWLDTPALGMSYGAAILATGMMAALPPFIRLALPNYDPVIPVLPILFLAGLINCLTYIPGMFLNSAFADQQAYYTKLWTGATAVFAAVLWLLLRAGFGLGGAAAAASIPPLLVVAFAIPKTYSYHLGSLRAALPHTVRLVAPIVFVVGAHGVTRLVMLRYAGAWTGNAAADDAIAGVVTLVATLGPLLALAWETFDFADLASRLAIPHVHA